MSDSSRIAQDSVVGDSTAPRSSSAIDSRIDYKASDSIFFNMENNKVFLFNQAQVNYQNIELKAGLIEVNFITQDVKANPRLDSNGQEEQIPYFNDGNQAFDADEMTYNFESKKARIKNVVTKEAEMYIHGEVVKKMPDDVAFVKNARFTTCDLEHPHFHVTALRAKIIPGDKVVTGGSMLFFNDIPTPLVLPFALFPNTSKHKSGILIPQYGEANEQGFFFRDGGFYWAINDYLDWQIKGDIYTRGDWALRNQVQYSKRYRYTGRVSFDYSVTQKGEKYTPEFAKSKGIDFRWQHQQSDKARPNTTFSADVNFFNSSSRTLEGNINDYAQNQSRSSISYTVRLADRYSISLASSLDYNINSGYISATLPTLNFSMNPIFPFRKKVRKGNAKWYESLNFNYTLNGSNSLRGQDSLFSSSDIFKYMKNGLRHNIPVSMNVKLFKGFLNWNHSARYSEIWSFSSIDKFMDSTGTLRKTDHSGFVSAREVDYNTSVSTTLYGMAEFKKGFFRAFRHVMTPAVGFSIRPDYNTYSNGFRYYSDTNGRLRVFNIFEGNPYIPGSSMRAGNVNFSLSNQLEMKVRDRKDSVTGTRKVKIIEDLNISTSYNLFADSLNWAPISISARTTLFKQISVNYNISFSLYAKDSNGFTYNEYIWKQKPGKWLLKESDNLSVSFGWTFGSKKKDGKTPAASGTSLDRNYHVTEDDPMYIIYEPRQNNIAWSVTLSYSMQYGSRYDARAKRFSKNTFSQTLNASGTLSLSDKWNITARSGFDFNVMKLSATEFSINRDLHCWSMSFTVNPFGSLQSWSFSIRANASMLSDALKYDKRKSHMDNDAYN